MEVGRIFDFTRSRLASRNLRKSLYYTQQQMLEAGWYTYSTRKRSLLSLFYSTQNLYLRLFVSSTQSFFVNGLVRGSNNRVYEMAITPTTAPTYLIVIINKYLKYEDNVRRTLHVAVVEIQICVCVCVCTQYLISTFSQNVRLIVINFLSFYYHSVHAHYYFIYLLDLPNRGQKIIRTYTHYIARNSNIFFYK